MEDQQSVLALVPLLHEPTLLATAKLLWLVLLSILGTSGKLPTKTSLAKRAGLSRPTVRKALAQLISLGWLSQPVEGYVELLRISDPKVEIPVDLLTDTSIGVRAKLIYGLLQTAPGYKNQKGSIRHSAFSRHVNLNVKTVRKALRELYRSGWVRATQENQLQPINFQLSDPDTTRVLIIQDELDKAENYCQTLAGCILTTVVDSDHYIDNSKPGYNRSVYSGALLEFDRLYTDHNVAFEYNGPQHYEATQLYDQKAVSAQKRRDREKRAICKEQGITLVEITYEDLSIEAITRLAVQHKLPLRDPEKNHKCRTLLEHKTRLLPKELPKVSNLSPTHRP